jgi:hypothetical protein
MDMRFETWNTRSLCRTGSLKTITSELAKLKLDLMGLQEVRRDMGSNEPPSNHTLFNGILTIT